MPRDGRCAPGRRPAGAGARHGATAACADRSVAARWTVKRQEQRRDGISSAERSRCDTPRPHPGRGVSSSQFLGGARSMLAECSPNCAHTMFFSRKASNSKENTTAAAAANLGASALARSRGTEEETFPRAPSGGSTPARPLLERQRVRHVVAHVAAAGGSPPPSAKEAPPPAACQAAAAGQRRCTPRACPSSATSPARGTLWATRASRSSPARRRRRRSQLVLYEPANKRRRRSPRSRRRRVHRQRAAVRRARRRPRQCVVALLRRRRRRGGAPRSTLTLARATAAAAAGDAAVVTQDVAPGEGIDVGGERRPRRRQVYGVGLPRNLRPAAGGMGASPLGESVDAAGDDAKPLKVALPAAKRGGAAGGTRVGERSPWHAEGWAAVRRRA